MTQKSLRPYKSLVHLHGGTANYIPISYLKLCCEKKTGLNDKTVFKIKEIFL